MLSEQLREQIELIIEAQDYMKHGWPQTDWGLIFRDIDEKFSQGYRIQKCILKYKRYSKAINYVKKLKLIKVIVLNLLRSI